MAIRSIDAETLTSYSWLGNRYQLIKRKQVSIAVVVLLVTFFTGAMAAMIWESAFGLILEQVGF